MEGLQVVSPVSVVVKIEVFTMTAFHSNNGIDNGCFFAMCVGTHVMTTVLDRRACKIL